MLHPRHLLFTLSLSGLLVASAASGASGEPFTPRPMVGLRLGLVAPIGIVGTSPNPDSYTGLEDFAGPGGSVEGDAGLRFSPSWALYGLWEYGRLGTTDRARVAPTTQTVGFGFNAVTSPDAKGALVFDLSLGYRWLSFSALEASVGPSGSTTRLVTYEYSGMTQLRVGTGFALAPTPRLRFDVMAQLAVGSFGTLKGPRGCEDGCPIASDVQYFAGFTSGARWEPF